MKRIIKFRAWDEHSKEMFSYAKPNDFVAFSVALTDKECHIMQYTGLVDKNGKEIYEGDIVRLINTHSRTSAGFVYKIVYAEDQMRFIFSRVSGMGTLPTRTLGLILSGMKRHNRLLVIGNIYENPELLESAD